MAGEEEKKKLSPLTIGAGAGASVLSMTIGSFFHTAGTLYGAAIGSVTYSVGAYYFEDRGRRARAKVLARMEQGKEPQESYERLQDLPLERSLIKSKTTEHLKDTWSPWKRTGLITGLIAVCMASALASLFIIEAATGKTLSSNLTGKAEYGTTWSYSTHSPSPAPSHSTPTQTPSAGSSAPSSPSPSPDATPSSPSPSATYTGVSSDPG